MSFFKNVGTVGAIASIVFPIYAYAQDAARIYVYSYVSPLLNLKAGVTLHSNQSVTAIQTSQNNVFHVTQYGPGRTNNAGVVQVGQNDLAIIRQIGQVNNGVIIQEGPRVRAYVSQIANVTAFTSAAP
jgi:hypothetical protein